MAEESMKDKPHFTARRGFIIVAAFSIVGLYVVWAVYGAAPLGLPAGGSGSGTEPSRGGQAGHGDPGALSPDEFERLAWQFIEANQLPDGSVQLRRPTVHQAESTTKVQGAHGSGAMAGHTMAPAAQPPSQEQEPVDVYLMAHQWGYIPPVLRLETNVPYRFRIMAVDTAHGVSVHLSPASRIVRLPAKTVVEQQVQFTKPGEFLLYCTTYCGLDHDRMQGKIIVTPQ